LSGSVSLLPACLLELKDGPEFTRTANVRCLGRLLDRGNLLRGGWLGCSPPRNN
jgi:hypothetical protein